MLGSIFAHLGAMLDHQDGVMLAHLGAMASLGLGLGYALVSRFALFSSLAWSRTYMRLRLGGKV